MTETTTAPMKWFYASTMGIYPEDVWRFTDKCVWHGQEHYQRRGSRQDYFPTLEEAKAAHLRKLDESITYWEEKENTAQVALSTLRARREKAANLTHD